MDAPGGPLRALHDDLQGLQLSVALEADPRPAFVLGRTRLGSEPARLSLLLHNEALANEATLMTSIKQTFQAAAAINSSDTLPFLEWLGSFGGSGASNPATGTGFRYRNIYWTSYIIKGQYQVVSGNQCEHYSESSTGSDLMPRLNNTSTAVEGSVQAARKNFRQGCKSIQDETDGSTRASPRSDALGAVDRRYDPKPPPTVEDAKVAIPPRLSTSLSSDWTAANPQGVLSEHEIFARNADWASTPLGPMFSWSAEFREVVNLLMRNPHPASLFWGQELTMIYNEPYSKEVAGKKHPGLMGSGFFGPFAELWESVRPIFQECARTGKSIRKENDRLLIERYGYLEETFFSWSWTPLYGGTDRILGFYNAPFETTYQTVSSRRMETLRHLGEQIAHARSVGHFWKGVLAGLEGNPYDIPFATLHSMTDADSSDTASISSSSTLSSKQCILEGTIAVPLHHSAAAAKVDLTGRTELAILFREAMSTHEPLLLQSSKGNFPEMFLHGISFRGFEIPSKEALIVPIRSMDGLNTLAVMLIGLNPRRMYDDDYKTFITMLRRQLTTSLASLLRMEDEKRKNRTAAELAALQREQLTQELALQTSRLRRMTEHSPLGMYLFSPDGVLLEANERYFQMTDHPRENLYEMSFLDILTASSQPRAQDMWHMLTAERVAQSEEIQLKHNYNTEINEETGQPIDCWVLVSAVPEIGQDGNLRSVMGSMTDISHMKWAQVLQEQRLREAEEGKRQQNAFIDITSHEMRNPMSAVLISADDIRESLMQPDFAGDTVVKECLEAVNTIILCVQHQKSIVDDILTISKLNSNLLAISPIPTQPVEVIQQAIKMFKNEAQTKGIELTLLLRRSISELNVDWVTLDPGRLLQITVNLITNAIKFTQQARRRQIIIEVGVSLDPPVSDNPRFEYVPTREPQTDVTTSSDWGGGSLVYLQVNVADTGCGLTSEEKQRLFKRFSQASPRTHAQYGGSGLGLFISRQLAELHGGQIGAASEAGSGSAFGFFVQCRRAELAILKSEASAVAASEIDPTHDVRVLAPAHGVPLSDSTPISRAFDPRTLHVLVVEDNLVNQKTLKRQLEKLGFSVDTADNGELALQYLETTDLVKEDLKNLSVILMDLEMPEMDGLTCVTRIRENEATGIFRRRTPVIAVTANVRVEQVQAARDSGMDDILSKPFRIPELLAKMEHLLGYQ